MKKRIWMFIEDVCWKLIYHLSNLADYAYEMRDGEWEFDNHDSNGLGEVFDYALDGDKLDPEWEESFNAALKKAVGTR